MKLTVEVMSATRGMFYWQVSPENGFPNRRPGIKTLMNRPIEADMLQV